MGQNQYYSSYKIPDKDGKVYVAVEHYSAEHQKVIGVVTGAESALVINAGMGMTGDIRKYVEELVGTDKTIECISLTGEVDDVGASAYFDVAYMNAQQFEAYEQRGSNQTLRKEVLKNQCQNNAETIRYAEALMTENLNIVFQPAGHGINQENIPVGPNMFDTVSDGYLYHLGGTVVEMAELPAQGAGQLVAICSTCCISFVGRALEPITDLSKLDREGLVRYKSALKKVIEYATGDTPYSEGLGRTPHLFFSDASAMPMQVKDVMNILEACEEVLQGMTDSDMPSGANKTNRIHFVENNGIIYNAEEIKRGIK